MASTFSQIKSGLDSISDRILANRNKILSAKQTLADAQADLVQLGTDYQALVQDIAAQASAAPTDTTLANENGQATKLVAEYNALKTVAVNAQAAINI